MQQCIIPVIPQIQAMSSLSQDQLAEYIRDVMVQQGLDNICRYMQLNKLFCIYLTL